MADSAAESDDEATGRPTAPEVEEYLRGHPAFLVEHADLLEVLTPPAQQSDGAVLDMQRFMLERMQGEMARLKDTQGALIAASRSNLATQAQVHAAVLALLEAESFEHLLHIVAADFAQFLDMDAVTLATESAVPPRMSQANFYILPKGSLDRMLGRQRDVRLRAAAPPLRAVFGPAAPLVRSDALVRLRCGDDMPAGLLAIGSRHEGKFHDGQGTELLLFLAQAVQRCLKAWLPQAEIPAPAPPAA